MDSKVRRQIEAIDWDFRESVRGASRSIHWYPGSFTSSVPGTLIEALSSEGEYVFDPYGGVGTTAVEALRLGRRAIVTETNPVGILTAFISCGLIEILKEHRSMLHSLIGGIRSLMINRNNAFSLFDDELPCPTKVGEELDFIINKRIKPGLDQFYQSYFTEFPVCEDLSKWIHPVTLDEIIELWKRLRDSSVGRFGSLMGLVLLSSRLKALCSQTRSWGHIADNVYPKEFLFKDVASEMKSALTTLVRYLDQLKSSNLSHGRKLACSVLDFNWLIDRDFRGRVRHKMDLLITSPPYANAIDYTKAQRLSLNLFGLSDQQINLKSQTEVGARTRRFKMDSLSKWLDQVEGALDIQLGSMSENGKVVLVLPHKDERRSDGCSSYINSIEDRGWSKVMTLHRSINELRTRQSWASIKFEEIAIFERS